MSKLVWGTVGTRFYEAGVDRGVLFIDDVGVVWNGLKSVQESPSGGEPKPFYIDGVKYLNLSSLDEYESTVNAFSAPDEFAACDGTVPLYAGLFLTHQPKKQFGFSYRTRVGNDLSGIEAGYKIHIVYNALARVANRNRQTVSSSAEPLDLSWGITATPPEISGYRPTAHIIIDSLLTDPVKLAGIEDMIYGTDSSESYLPSIDEILEWFALSFDELVVTDHGEGTFTISGPDDVVYLTDVDTFEVDSPDAVEEDVDTYSVSSA